MTSRTAPTHRQAAKSIIARNTAWNYAGFVLNLGLNFALFPFVVGWIGEAAAGVWLLLGSVTGYMGLLELGLVPALAQRVAADLGRGERREVAVAVSTALTLLAGLAVLALQALWFVPLLVHALKVPADLADPASAVFVVAISGFALKMPLAAPQALLLGSQRQDRCNQLWILQAAARAALTVGVLIAGLGVVAVVVVEALVPLLSAPLQIRWVRHEFPDLRLRWRGVDPAVARALVTFGGSILAINVCSLIVEQTDRLVVGAFRPIAEVTHYSAAWKLYMLAYALPTIVLQAVTPMAASFHGRGDRDGLKRLFLRMAKYSVALALPLTLALGLTAGSLLRIWMGPGFIDARWVVAVLAASFAVTSFNHAGYSVLVGTRQVSALLWLYWAPQAVLNLGLSLWLVGPLGIVGVALGTAIPAVLLEYPFLRYVLGRLDVSWGEFLRGVVRPTVIPAAVAFVPLGLVYAAAGPVSLALPAIAAGCGAGFAALFWATSLDNAERADLVGLVRSRLRATAAADA